VPWFALVGGHVGSPRPPGPGRSGTKYSVFPFFCRVVYACALVELSVCASLACDQVVAACGALLPAGRGLSGNGDYGAQNTGRVAMRSAGKGFHFFSE